MMPLCLFPERTSPQKGLALAILAGLGSLSTVSYAAEPVCVESEAVCVDTADRIIDGETVSKPCWRYEKRIRCFSPHADALACTGPNLPASCTAGEARCTKEDETMGCLETETPLSCTAPVGESAAARADPFGRVARAAQSAEAAARRDARTAAEASAADSAGDGPSRVAQNRGIAALDPVVEVSYAESIEGDATLGEGCRIESERCLDSTPREIAVENWPGHTATATPPCWATEVTVSCPTADGAESCQKLVDAGCTQTGETVCAEEQEGVCVRWRQTYRCGNPVTGDGIVTEGPVDEPDGGVATDDSACRKELDDAIDARLSCEAVSSVCVKPGDTVWVEGRPVTIDCAEKEVVYRCRGEGEKGCKALEALADEGVCRRETEPVCEKEDASGCLVWSSVFRCGPDAAPLPDSAEDLGTVEEVTMKPSDGCAEEEASGVCKETSRVCTEGAGVKFVDGKYVYKDCWAWSVHYTCLTTSDDDCAKWEADPECRLVSEVCPEGDECLRPLRTYECTRLGESFELGETCSGEVCVGDLCHTTDGPADEDLADAIVQIEIGRQLGLYGDVTRNRFFSGEALQCKDRKGAPSCCRSEVVAGMSNTSFTAYLVWGAAGAAWEGIKFVGSPYVYDLLAWSEHTEWLLNALYGSAASGAYNPSFSFWGASVTMVEGELQFSFSVEGFLAAAALQFWERHKTCDAEDQKVAMARGQGLCHFIGTHCVDKVPGLGCTKREEVYVCFNSLLARLINEQGRAQIGRGWGSVETPDARGFTIEEIEELDFTEMDFTAFVQDVLREVQSKGEFTDEATLARIQERLQEMLSGEAGIFGPMKNPEYATDTRPNGKRLWAGGRERPGEKRPAFLREGWEQPSPRIEAYLKRNGLYGYDGQE